MEALRQEVSKVTRETEEKTTSFPAKRLIELLKTTLRKFCKTVFKQHINFAKKLAYSKHCEAKHVDILCKAKENADKEQVKAKKK